jgi:hypothetical protein
VRPVAVAVTCYLLAWLCVAMLAPVETPPLPGPSAPLEPCCLQTLGPNQTHDLVTLVLPPVVLAQALVPVDTGQVGVAGVLPPRLCTHPLADPQWPLAAVVWAMA